MSSLDYLDLCRLCLVKDRVSVPIFEDEGDVRQIFLKITACLPVKVAREDKLPKKICDDCVYKVELFYQFWNTTANAEKQLLQWLGEVGGLDDKQAYEVLDTNVMKQERVSDSRLDGNVMQVGGHQNNMDMGIMDNMSLIPMSAGSEQQFTPVPMDASGTAQAVPGPSTQARDQVVEEEEESDEEDNSDGCDNDEGLPVKQEHEEGQSDQPLESTQFVSLPCDEAGPSGLQQQKMSEMSEMTLQQTADNDPKTGAVAKSEPKYLDTNEQHIFAVGTKIDMVDEAATVVEKKVQTTVDKEEEEEEDEIKVYEQFEEIDDDAVVVQELSPDKTAETVEFEEIDDTVVQELSSDKTVQTVEFEDSAGNSERGLVISSQLANEPDNNLEPIHSLLVRMESGVLKRIFQCSKCDVVFASAKMCVRHVTTAHPRSRKYRVAYRCRTCQKLFRTKYSCENHIQGKHKHRTFECRYCGFKTASMTYIKKHERNHVDDYEIRCDICNKGFASKTVLERHIISHTGEKPFTCTVCNLSYADKRSLQLHATVHDPAGRPKKYTCEVCDYSSFWKNAVKTHMKIHTGAKVICDECGQAVASNYYLKIHKRIHSDEKPFTCEICSKNFRQMKNLVVHQRVHNKIKPYKCNDCGKSFSQNVWLKKHKCNTAE